jgi:hypothetical protein
MKIPLSCPGSIRDEKDTSETSINNNSKIIYDKGIRLL